MHYRKKWHPIQPKSSQEKNHSKASAISSFSLSVLRFIRRPFSCTRPCVPEQRFVFEAFTARRGVVYLTPCKIEHHARLPNTRRRDGYRASIFHVYTLNSHTNTQRLAVSLSLSLSLYGHLLIAPPKNTPSSSLASTNSRMDGPQPQTNQAPLLTLALTWNWSATRRHSARRRSGRGRGREGGERRPPRPAAGAKTTGCWRTPSWC